MTDDRIAKLTAAIMDATGTDEDTCEWLAIGVFQVLAVMKLESQCKPVLAEAKVNAAYRRAGEIKDAPEPEPRGPFAEGELIEYESARRGGQLSAQAAWLPGVFRSYPFGPLHPERTVIQLDDAMRRVTTRYVVRQSWQVRPVDPGLVSAARSWIADCSWPDLGEGDVGDLTDVEVAAGIQRHYSGGWAQFKADGGHLPPMAPDRS